ncbi:MAG: hypothetical protein ACRECD_14870 [Burkholderiaceae bacterium]
MTQCNPARFAPLAATVFFPFQGATQGALRHRPGAANEVAAPIE